MSSMVRRTIAIAVVAIALLAGAIWLIASLRDDGGEEDTSGRGAAVMPSDGGGTDPDRAEGTDEDHQEQDEASAASEVSEQPEITGDFTDPAGGPRVCDHLPRRRGGHFRPHVPGLPGRRGDLPAVRGHRPAERARRRGQQRRHRDPRLPPPRHLPGPPEAELLARRRPARCR